MTIFYSSISRGTTILCSHGFQEGTGHNYEQAAETVLPSVPTRNDGKTSVTANSYKFHCIVENGIIFMCAAKAGFEAGTCFGFLTEIKDQFHNKNLSSQAVSAGKHEFDAEFNNILAKQMEKFSKPGTTGKLGVLQGQVKEVTSVMSQNIESVIQRGEGLDDLMDKTDDLEAASATFQRTASKIRKKYWWKNTKMKIIVACVVFVIVVAILMAILYGAGVFNSSDKTTAAPAPATPASTVISPAGLKDETVSG